VNIREHVMVSQPFTSRPLPQGMTDEQSKAFEKRRERIAELTARLEQFKDAA